jgi:hypothetical protein
VAAGLWVDNFNAKTAKTAKGTAVVDTMTIAACLRVFNRIGRHTHQPKRKNIVVRYLI